jgi:hypothetical protein
MPEWIDPADARDEQRDQNIERNREAREYEAWCEQVEHEAMQEDEYPWTR